MSVNCEMFVGYTVTLKTKLNHEDFDFFNKFSDTSNVLLVVDGMCGEYARLIFVDKHLDECWLDGEDIYFQLNNSNLPENVYNELNQMYRNMYGEELEMNSIEYALWSHYT